jgi:hypothetical protein
MLETDSSSDASKNKNYEEAAHRTAAATIQQLLSSFS